MRFSTALAFVATTAAAIAAAQPHRHQHRHVHGVKRDVTITENVPGPTVVAYELNGHEIDVDQVCAGIADGSLKWAEGGAPSGVCSLTAVSTSAAPTSTSLTSAIGLTTSHIQPMSSSDTAAKSYEQFSSAKAYSSGPPTSISTKSATSVLASSISAAPAAPSTTTSSGNSSRYGGLDMSTSFPDGTVDCSDFPSQYGAVHIDYLKMGGWIGLQEASDTANIITGIAGQTCDEGWMCSYACPPGYQKSQWPSQQGSTGQSIGGLKCSHGKLRLTNPNLSSSLCVRGTGGVQAKNNAGSVVSICRTDYPGTESETIPVALQPGSSEELACPEAASYYIWEGKSTSAQYYLNPPGYGPSEACQWGRSSQPIGNYAPLNFGVGSKDGTTWLSIMANKPTTTATYPGTVEIQGNISGSCKYENGMFHSATGSNSDGCTVSLTPIILTRTDWSHLGVIGLRGGCVRYIIAPKNHDPFHSYTPSWRPPSLSS